MAAATSLAATVTQVSAPDFCSLGLHPDDAAELAEVVRHGFPGHLVIVECPDTGLAFAAATAAARSLLPAQDGADLHLAVAEGDRWTVGEVDDRILRPARFKAFEQTHIVVAEADQMAPISYDHLLKTVEEPVSGALFWFAVGSVDQLPATLRGRAGTVLQLRSAPAEQRVQLLESAGAQPEQARQIAELAGDDVRLALAVAASTGLLADLQRYGSSPLLSADVTASSDELLEAVLRLAAAMPAPGTDHDGQPKRKPRGRKAAAVPRGTLRPRWDALPLAARPDARRLLRRLLDRWTTQTRSQLSFPADAGELRRLDLQLRALYQARQELATNASAAVVLPALRSRCAAVR